MDSRERYCVNQDPTEIIPNIRHFALDMDGTVYLEETWIDGALDFFRRVEETGRSYCFMTNNSSKDRDTYAEKLRRMGLEVKPETQIITSGHATIAYLKKHYSNKRVFLLGNPLLTAEFEAEGVWLDDQDPEVVVSSFDTTLTYKKLRLFCDFVREGRPYLATHPDYNCLTATGTGIIPDIGATHAYVEASTGRMPDRIMGKPNREIVDYMLEVTRAERRETAVVGDRLYTDIKCGEGNGLYSIFVLSGEAQLKDLPNSEVQPDLIFDSLKELIPLL